MPFLQDFTEEQRILIVSLPFRAGMWVSESDSSGGGESATAEMQALEGILVGYSEDFLKSEFVEEVVKITLSHKDKWPAWRESLDGVPAQCEQAVDILIAVLQTKDVASYKKMLMEVATAVATAFREEETVTKGLGSIPLYVRYYWQTCLARFKNLTPPTMDEFFNVSQAERDSLSTLAQVLGVQPDGSPLKSVRAA